MTFSLNLSSKLTLFLFAPNSLVLPLLETAYMYISEEFCIKILAVVEVAEESQGWIYNKVALLNIALFGDM